MKICSKCKKEKNISEFRKRKDSKDGFRSSCKSCDDKRTKAWIEKNPERKKANCREWARKHRAKNPEFYKKKAREEKWRSLGINCDDEDYNKLFFEQGGKCAICGIHQRELNYRLNLDHDHITKEVRGLLCWNCNGGLGQFKVDQKGIKLLEESIKYLKGKK